MKANRKRLKIIALVLVAVGVALFAVSAVMEAQKYPWERLLGLSSQSADSIPDPSPIILDAEDAEAVVTTESGYPADETTPSATSDSVPPDSTPIPSESVQPSAENSAALPGDENETKKAPAATKYVVIGILKIPALNVSQNILEGAGKQMKYGVGHLPSTAAIGAKGNCAIAGHRPYPFRYLDQLKAGEKITLKAGGIQYTYTVFDSFAVLPNEVWVLNSVEGKEYTLTLITCTPYMVSSHRLIIRAELTDINGMTPQAFYGEQSPVSEVPAPETSPVTDVVVPGLSPEPAESQTAELSPDPAAPTGAAADSAGMQAPEASQTPAVS